MLVCYNDGKEKAQSFEVWDTSFSDIEKGYGRNYTEAKYAFFKHMADYAMKLSLYMMTELQTTEAVEVDCFGELVKGRDLNGKN